MTMSVKLPNMRTHNGLHPRRRFLLRNFQIRSVRVHVHLGTSDDLLRLLCLLLPHVVHRVCSRTTEIVIGLPGSSPGGD